MIAKDSPDASQDNCARRYATAREWFVDALCLAMGAAAIVRHQSDGILVMAIIFVGACAVSHFVASVMWQAHDSALAIVTVLIFLLTIGYAFTTLSLLPATLLSLFLPVIAQAYVIWDTWPATSHPLHPFTLLCLIWLVLAAVCLLEPDRFRRLTPLFAARRRRV